MVPWWYHASMEHDTEMGRLINKIIENLPVQSKGYILWDGETKGFGIRININGKKTFILKYRIGQGRRAKIKKPVIGTFGVIKTEQATCCVFKYFTIEL